MLLNKPKLELMKSLMTFIMIAGAICGILYIGYTGESDDTIDNKLFVHDIRDTNIETYYLKDYHNDLCYVMIHGLTPNGHPISNIVPVPCGKLSEEEE